MSDKPKKTKIKKLTNEKLLEEIKKIQSFNIKKIENPEFLNEIKKIHIEALNKVEKKFSKQINSALSKIPSYLNSITKTLKDVDSSLLDNKMTVTDMETKLDQFEEALLHIMHNIKKNQFLYAHYPEEWVKNYLSIKKGIKYENEFMEDKDVS